MTTIDHIRETMGRLGPIDDSIITIVEIDDATWMARYENLDVEIEFDRVDSTVALQADVAVVSPSERGDLYAAMMQYNLLQRDTGGIVLAAKADHTVVQMLDLGSEDFDEHALETVLTNFTSKVRVWRSLVASKISAEDEVLPNFDEDVFTIRI